MKRFIILIFLVLLLASVAFYFLKPKDQGIHYHAGFIVFENNAQKDFSALQYMKANPCNIDGSHGVEEKQLEKAHLHDGVGNVVHVHRDAALWSDLFTNIEYPIDYANTKAYSNDKEIINFPNQPIQVYDSVVILVGENDLATASAKAVTKAHIEEIEKRSEDCGV